MGDTPTKDEIDPSRPVQVRCYACGCEGVGSGIRPLQDLHATQGWRIRQTPNGLKWICPRCAGGEDW